MQIVDAHHHLWDLSAVRYPWLLERGVARFFGDPTPIQKDYLVADFKDDARAVELRGSVHIQVGAAASDEIAETAWQQKNAESSGLPSAIVAACDLTRSDLDTALAQHEKFAGLRGIRQIVGRADSEDRETGTASLLVNPAWCDGLTLLKERGLSFDLQLTPRQMIAAAKVFSDIPGLRVALCHAGSPMHFNAAGVAQWRDGINALSEIDTLYCKLSGFGMFNHNWRVSDIAPYIEYCIEAFGVQRCMFGSNFPVDKLYRDYASIWRAYQNVCAPLASAEQQCLFVANADRFYRLELEI